MNNETKNKYVELVDELNQVVPMQYRIEKLNLLIRKLQNHNESEKRHYYRLIDEGELPFPEDAYPPIQEESDLIDRLKLKLDEYIIEAKYLPRKTSEPAISEINTAATNTDNSGEESNVFSEKPTNPENTKPSEQQSKNKNEEYPEIMDSEMVRSYLQLSKSKLYDLTRHNNIPLFRIGRECRFRKKDIDEWCDKQVVESSSEK